MARRRQSAAVLAVAIMNLVLGVPCLICVPIGLVATEALKGAAKQNPAAGPNNPFGRMDEQQKFMEQEAPGYQVMQYVGATVSILFALGLILSAVLLLSGKPLGRTLCIAVCACFAIWTLAHAVYQVAVVMPASKKFLDQQMQKMGGTPAPKGLFEASTGVGIAINVFIGVGYPILATALLLSPGARKALSSRSVPEDFEDRRDDDDEIDDRFRAGDDEFDRPDDRFR